MTRCNPYPIALFITCTFLGGCASEQVNPAPSAKRPQRKLSYEDRIGAATAYLGAGKAEKALEQAQEANRDTPNRFEGHQIAGRAYATLGDLPKAIGSYETALSLGDPRRETFIELASAYDVNRDYDGAAKIYRTWLDRNPADLEMRHELGLTLLLNEKPLDAMTVLSRVLAEATEANSPLVPQIKLDIGYAQLVMSRIGDAIATFTELTQSHPKNAMAWQLLAQGHIARGENDKAVAMLDRAIAISRTDPAPVRMRARANTLLKDFAAAEADYLLLTKADAKDAGAWVGLCGALLQQEKLTEADGALTHAAGLVGPNNPQIEFRRAQLAWRRGDKAALDTLKTFAEKHPAVLEAWQELNRASRTLKRPDLVKRAETEIQRIKADKQR